ncbi:MAG: aminopeptidase P family N-terminal domain-containing protein, partial [Actinobacteria bacterium]|nr:aminopeptidase P family N-terminal domain-containing protein [Actinomycetota bacterium]
MQRRGFDALVFVGADSRGQKGALRYVADYDLSGRYGYAVLAPGAEPVCILPRSMAGMPRSTWVEDSRFPLNTASGLCEALKQLPSRERVGIVGRDAIMAIGEYEHLCAELPDTEFADASDLLDRVRAQKSEEEIRGLKESAWIADQCHQRLLEIARPGMTERALNTALVTVMAEHGGEDPIFLIMDERPGDGHSARYRVPRDEIVGTAR